MNLVDESIFEVNKNFDLSVEEIGNLNSKIIKIDNFLLHPEKLLKFLETFPFQNKIYEGVTPRGYYPGWQLYLNYNFGEIERCVNFLLGQHLGYTPNYINFSFQCVDGNKKVHGQSSSPHCDESEIAGNLFLNTDNEITKNKNTGTTFYRLKETGEECIFPGRCNYRKQRYRFLNPDLKLQTYDPIWEEDDKYVKYHFAEAKFNRLYMYEGKLFHSVYMDKGTFKDCMRKTFSFVG